MPVLRLKKIFPVVIVALLASSICRADQIKVNEAEKLYQSGEFEKARQVYRAELDATPVPEKLPSSFFYNYGTILARAGAAGEAYVSLLRAAFAEPFDGDVRHNLWRVEQTMPAAVRAVQPSLWYGFWPRSLRVFPWQAWLLVALLLSAFSLLLINAADKTVTWSLGLLAILLFCVAGMSYFQLRLPVGGITKIAQVKSGPGATFTDIVSLEPGSLVNLDGSRDGWRKIRFTRGQTEETVGWVQPTAILEVLR